MKDPHIWYDDGFCGGSELPTDTELDQLIFPERCEEPMEFPLLPFGTSRDDYAAAAERAAVKREEERMYEDRQFVQTLDNATGRVGGPPRMPK